MKRKILLGTLAALSALCLSLGLTACGKKDDGSIHLIFEYDKEREAYAVTGLANIPTEEELKINPDLPRPDSTLEIPATYEDAPVYIAEGAFSGYDFLEKVELEAGVLSIEKSAFSDCAALREVGLSAGLTSIGETAFANCPRIVGVTLPASLQELGGNAFYGCSSLKTIGVDASNSAFAASENILYNKGFTEIVFVPAALEGEVTLPATLNTLGEGAFFGHSLITKVTVQGDMTEIGANTFADCTSLKEVVLPAGITKIGVAAFKNCSALADFPALAGVTAVGAGAFENCDALEDARLPDSVGSVGARVFASCDSLRSVTLPQGLKKIPEGFFAECGLLSSVEIPEGVAEIGSYAFSGCVSLEEVRIPAATEKLGDRAFFGCSAVTAYTVGEGNAAYHAQNGCLIDADGTLLYGGVPANKKVVVGADVVKIAPYAFRFTEAESVSLPAGLTAIGADAFFGCSMLGEIEVAAGNEHFCTQDNILYSISQDIYDPDTGLTETKTFYSFFLVPVSLGGSVTVKEGTESIPANAFSYREQLESIVLPAGLSSIGESAFTHCTALTSVTFSQDIETVGANAFEACTALQAIEFPEYVAQEETDTPPAVSLANHVFFGCSDLKEVKFSRQVSSVAENVFEGCSSLEKIEVGAGNVNYLGKDGILYRIFVFNDQAEISGVVHVPLALQGEIALAEGLTSVDSGLFSGRTGILSVTIPASVQSIGENAFSGCTSLGRVIFADGTDDEGKPQASKLSSIGSYAFEGCVSLASIELPAGLTSIGNYAFAGAGLISIELPAKVTSVGQGAFSGCLSLGEVVFTAEEGEDASTVFFTVGGFAFENCAALQSVTLTKGITSLGSNAFDGCISLTAVHYAGAARDWANVTVGSGNEILGDVLDYSSNA